MKKVRMFYLEGCPYCKKALEYMREMISEKDKYADVKFELIEESERPEIVDYYMYEYVPCYFIDKNKIFEAHSMISDDELKEGVKRVFEAALRTA